MPSPSPSLADKRRSLVLLRGVLLVAVGGLLIGSSGAAHPGSLALVILFVFSELVLALMPLRWLRSVRVDLVVGAADLALVALGIHLAGALGGVLPISCLLMALVVALGDRRTHAVAGAAAVGALHGWLVFGQNEPVAATWMFALQFMFLCAVGLYYGYLAGAVHRARRRQDADDLETRELSTLHDILTAVSTTLDLRRVFAIIVERISAVVPTRRCSMIYVNERRTRFFVMASHDDPDCPALELDPRRYPEIRKAMKTRRPVHIEDVSIDPLMAEVRDLLQDVDLRSVLVVPLTVGDEVQGLLCLRTARPDHHFLKRDIEFCAAVARAAANALMISNRLRRTEKKLLTILDHSSDLIVTTDPLGRILQVNRGGLRLLGYSAEQLRGDMCGRLFHDSEGTDFLRRVAHGEVFLNHACRVIKRNGTELKVELNTAFLRNEVHEPTGVVWIARDVTELEDAQMQLLQAEKLSSMGEVISGVAHELNNPLSGVIGYSQLLMMSDVRGEYRRELEKINESASRCQRIVKNLLSFSRAQRSERRYLGLNGIIEKTLELKRYQLALKDVEVMRQLDPTLPRTMLDYHQIQQMLLNLLNNAEHAMGGVDRRGRLAVRTWHESGTLRLEVEDNGEGMAPGTVERVFDPFFTTKPQGDGAGLGLSISYGIVKEHGGEIRVRSRRGAGTTFCVELPVVQPAGEGAESRDPSGGAAVGAKAPPRILVVDDEPVILDLLVDVLTRRGYRVDTASNGEEAERKLLAESYAVLLADIRMPRMSGIELYRRVVGERPELCGRVVFMTGDIVAFETHRMLEDLDAPTLSKPIDLPELVRTIESMLAAEPAPTAG